MGQSMSFHYEDASLEEVVRYRVTFYLLGVSFLEPHVVPALSAPD